VSKSVPDTAGFCRLGLASSEKQIPQIVETVANSKHGMERLERLGMLGKQTRRHKIVIVIAVNGGKMRTKGEQRRRK
jgi:hypothetical protein